jgi:glycosyltransferase involved in cell wall biosynthesis
MYDAKTKIPRNQERKSMITVIVCTYNPRSAYFSRLLGALAGQTLPKEHWELILVDNNSMTILSESYPLSTLPNSIWLREERQGKVNALIRGIKAAKGDLIVTFDDDNVPSRHYLERLLDLYKTNPLLGCVGAGSVEPEFETTPSAWIRPFLCHLALRQVNEATICDSAYDPRRPWGLGMGVSRDVARLWLAKVSNGLPLTTSGRKASSMEDCLFSLCSTSLGKKIGIFPELALTHLISKDRLTLPYIRRHVYDQSYSHAHYSIIGDQPLTNPHSHLSGSLKTALVLLAKGKFMPAYFEYNRLIRGGGLSPEGRINRSKAAGWDQAIRDYQSLGPSKVALQYLHDPADAAT